jgi:hypothetical protein
MSMRTVLTLFVGVTVFSSCGYPDASPTESDSIVALEGAFMVAGCDTKDLKKFSRDYFSRPEEAVARGIVSDLGDACGNGDAIGASDLAFDLLALVSAVLTSGNQGDASDGNLLVGEALMFASLDCGAAACLPSVSDFTGALSLGGAFAVVGAGDTNPIVARGLPVGDTWLIEIGPDASDWAGVFGQRSVVVGAPASANVPVFESPLPPIQYEWNVIPDSEDGFVVNPVVGVCEFGTTLNLIPTVVRNTTLLQPADVFACGLEEARTPQDPGSRLLRFADWLLGAQPLHALLQGGRGTGGRPTDFSTFVAVEAVANGQLVFVGQPQPVDTAGSPIGGPVQVRAETDLGTPIEHVLIRLTAEVNNGSTVEIVNNEAFTQEGGGIASFPDVSINKPGGYVLCAEAIQTDGVAGTSYVIASACSDPLHIRNSN